MNKEKKISKKEENKNIGGEKVYKVNIDFLDFVKKVMNEKLLNLMNEEKLKELYLSECRLKSSKNIGKIVSRNILSEFRREKVLNYCKENNLKFEEMKEICEELVVKIRGKNSVRYI